MPRRFRTPRPHHMPRFVYGAAKLNARKRAPEALTAASDCKGAPMDFKKFYFSPEARVDRKQWWLWLVLPFTVISILLGFVDTAIGNYNPESGLGLFSAPDRARLPQGNPGAKPVRSAGDMSEARPTP